MMESQGLCWESFDWKWNGLQPELGNEKLLYSGLCLGHKPAVCLGYPHTRTEKATKEMLRKPIQSFYIQGSDLLAIISLQKPVSFLKQNAVII